MSKGTINKAIVLGRVGQDPEMKATASGLSVINVSVATNSVSGSGDNRREETEWHRVTMFGKLAEITNQYVRKGSLIYVEGRLQTRKWQDQNGQDRYSTDIIANEMQMIGSKSDNQGGYQAQDDWQQGANDWQNQNQNNFSQPSAQPRQQAYNNPPPAQQPNFQQPPAQQAPEQPMQQQPAQQPPMQQQPAQQPTWQNAPAQQPNRPQQPTQPSSPDDGWSDDIPF